MQVQEFSHYSRANVLAQSTSPLDISGGTLCKLAELSEQGQWIMFTNQCPRPDYMQMNAFNVRCNKVIHLKHSQTMSEFEVAMKAIQSGNASAVVATTTISPIERSLLQGLALQFQCEIFFVEGSLNQYH